MIYIFSYKVDEDGNLIPFNATHVFNTRRCCDNYTLTGTECVRDYCTYLQCEDPNSRCVIVQKCGEIFPVFVTEQGILSDKCTQPKESEGHLCPNEVCSVDSTCPGDTTGEAVCLASGCDCTPSPAWYLPDLSQATC